MFDDSGKNEERPNSRSRREEKWSSTVFSGPLLESPTRKHIAPKDTGTDKLFGEERMNYENTSNYMPILAGKKKSKYPPAKK